MLGIGDTGDFLRELVGKKKSKICSFHSYLLSQVVTDTWEGSVIETTAAWVLNSRVMLGKFFLLHPAF